MEKNQPARVAPVAIQRIVNRSDNDRSKILKFENSPFRWRQFLTAL